MAVQIIPDSEEFEKRIELKLQKMRESILNDLKIEFDFKRPEEFLTRDEVAKMLKVHVCTIDDWTDKDKLKKYQIYGRKSFYKYSEVEASLILVKTSK
ncbi:helix-turn-helix transcriptional regulator [Salegentibacter mishustinae]|uniref:helix-turn-helix transcriptional regulator n=1 Tax=Salegentibacter mishustinae TaxID=270918 RepID=UPI00248F623C|nr:helix-turn-helix domain-containing protein [Salegentibacter mishustinae]